MKAPEKENKLMTTKSLSKDFKDLWKETKKDNKFKYKKHNKDFVEDQKRKRGKIYENKKIQSMRKKTREDYEEMSKDGFSENMENMIKEKDGEEGLKEYKQENKDRFETERYLSSKVDDIKGKKSYQKMSNKNSLHSKFVNKLVDEGKVDPYDAWDIKDDYSKNKPLNEYLKKKDQKIQKASGSRLSDNREYNIGEYYDATEEVKEDIRLGVESIKDHSKDERSPDYFKKNTNPGYKLDKKLKKKYLSRYKKNKKDFK